MAEPIESIISKFIDKKIDLDQACAEARVWSESHQGDDKFLQYGEDLLSELYKNHKIGEDIHQKLLAAIQNLPTTNPDEDDDEATVLISKPEKSDDATKIIDDDDVSEATVLISKPDKSDDATKIIDDNDESEATVLISKPTKSDDATKVLSEEEDDEDITTVSSADPEKDDDVTVIANPADDYSDDDATVVAVKQTGPGDDRLNWALPR